MHLSEAADTGALCLWWDVWGAQIRPEGKHLPSTCHMAGASVGSLGDTPAGLGVPTSGPGDLT